MTAHYWCELAWLGGPRAAQGVVIAVDGDRIAAVCAGVPVRPEGAVPLAGLTLPALANAHSHAFHRALRGRTHDGRGVFDVEETLTSMATSGGYRSLGWPEGGRLEARARQPARPRAGRAARRGNGLFFGGPLHLPVRRRHRSAGRLTNGSPAHVTILDAPSRHHLAYRPGVPLIWQTLGADYRLPPADDQQ